MNYRGCSHLTSYASKHLNTFRFMHSSLVTCSTESLKLKSELGICEKCKLREWRLHVCLYCVYVGCYEKKHIHEHAHEEGHDLAADLEHGYIYCFPCGDYTYDSELELIARKFRSYAAKSLAIMVPHFPWEPNLLELKCLNANPEQRQISKNSYLGLRGLVNFGNTCYMNCIIQVFMHIPILRNYFFSDCHICPLESTNDCFACEISSLFQEFYSGECTPYSPTHLLHLVWTAFRDQFRGDRQFDAHEFLLEMLEILSRNCAPDRKSGYCHFKTNIYDQVFSGMFLSEIKCLMCNNISSKHERFIDISLGLGLPVQNKISKSVIGREATESLSLESCLRRYTSLETPVGNFQVTCTNCNAEKGAAQQITFQKLPIIISIHLKRFETSTKKATTTYKKLEDFVSFPEVLDMTPFMYYNCNDASLKSNGASHRADDYNKYDLFAVIEHIGRGLQNGHYVVFIKHHKDQWYRCADHCIQKVNISEVLKISGYMLFYQRQILEYE